MRFGARFQRAGSTGPFLRNRVSKSLWRVRPHASSHIHPSGSGMQLIFCAAATILDAGNQRPGDRSGIGL